MNIGHFPTRSSIADELFLLIWKAVAYLVIICGLKVRFIKVLKILELAKLCIINQSEKISTNIIKFPICRISWVICQFYIFHMELWWNHFKFFWCETWTGIFTCRWFHPRVTRPPQIKGFTGFTGLEMKTWFSLRTIPSPLKSNPSISFLMSHTSSKP